MYVYMCVCMYVCVYVCLYVCMYMVYVNTAFKRTIYLRNSCILH